MKVKTGIKAGEDPSLSPTLELPIEPNAEECSAQSTHTSEPVQSNQPSLSD